MIRSKARGSIFHLGETLIPIRVNEVSKTEEAH